MQFHRDTSDSINIIRAFDDTVIRVGESLLKPPCVIAVSEIIEQWTVGDIAGLRPDQLEPIIALEPELIILGSGSSLKFPSHDVIKIAHAKGIGLEVMDTAAGCRTYNLLAHEGRNVALALLPA